MIAQPFLIQQKLAKQICAATLDHDSLLLSLLDWKAELGNGLGAIRKSPPPEDELKRSSENPFVNKPRPGTQGIHHLHITCLLQSI